MIIVGIDPGPTSSGMVVYDTDRRAVSDARSDISNDDLRALLPTLRVSVSSVAIERVVYYGQSVGSDVFETAYAGGRIHEAAFASGYDVYRVDRRQIKRHLCNSPRARDPDIRNALIDMHGGKRAYRGTKKEPGPLYGVSGHAWAALAVAVTAAAAE